MSGNVKRITQVIRDAASVLAAMKDIGPLMDEMGESLDKPDGGEK